LSSELAGSRHSAFVDPTGFWHALFQTEFPKYISFLENQCAANWSQRVRYSPFLPTFVSIARGWQTKSPAPGVVGGEGSKGLKSQKCRSFGGGVGKASVVLYT
jgi:hypothetical protein